jgi:Zn-dependent peptidase ImmA (M78 family)
MASAVDIPWLEPNEIKRRAAEFLQKKHPTNTLPVPVELIVERMGIDIVPLENLKDLLNTEGCTSANRRTIFVDNYVSRHVENRYRFTLAHELGHITLHPSLFDCLAERTTTVEAWMALLAEIPAKTYQYAEWQANAFGGLILVPPKQLKTQYDQCIPKFRTEVQKIRANGKRSKGIDDYAWQLLAARIAKPFEVSAAVILKRLSGDGYSVADI